MLVLRRSVSQTFLPALLVLASAVCIAQAPAQDSAPPATDKPAASCPALGDSTIPVNSAVEARVTSIDSSKLKPGKEIWLKVAHGVIYDGCRLEPDSVVYAHVLSASGGKGATSSDLSLSFDHADCSGHDKQPFKLHAIAVLGPPDARHNMHEAMPTQVAGSGRQIDSAMESTNAADMELNPGGPPHTVRPGIVVGVPNLKLEPAAGPECSDKMTSTASKVQLGPGAEFILALTQTR
ncbi:MAG: hypothetical protein JST28_12905 [Acidobacteria bacterium]|nr:hypothetical protein [Acidobacteriota bacterium]